MGCLICPICKVSLDKKGKSYCCENLHTFDISAEGYVHLLPAGKSNSKMPGDNIDMVNSRTNFLNFGGYDIFADGICKIAEKYVKNPAPTIIDAGCGEGYYTNKLKSTFPFSDIVGIDISKFAVKHAAKHSKDITFAVAGVYDMPVKSSCADLVVSIFSPIAEEEFCRICKSGSYLLIAVPGARHLFGMKEILYKNPYENEIINTEYKGFCFVERVPINGILKISNSELIHDLFTMTPYYWKTDLEGKAHLANAEKLETEIEFDILIYRKI